jgi:alkylation response protein AidB-like acyl-CoA dehydrogenase
MIPMVNELGCTAMQLFGSDVQSRTAFGQAWIEHQAVGFMLVDMPRQIRAARRLVYEANRLLGELSATEPTLKRSAG